MSFRMTHGYLHFQHRLLLCALLRAALEDAPETIGSPGGSGKIADGFSRDVLFFCFKTTALTAD